MSQVGDDIRGGVVLLHGLGRLAGSVRFVDRGLRRAGFDTIRLNYPARRLSLAKICDGLKPQVERFAARLDGPVHFVGHSLGGLVIRAYIACYRPANLGRVVMLATPNGGSEYADRLTALGCNRLVLGPVGRHLSTRRTADAEAELGCVDYPVGVIAGDRGLDPIAHFVLPHPHDGKVSVEATRLSGMADHITLPVTHALMMFDRTVTLQTIEFLSKERFRRDQDDWSAWPRPARHTGPTVDATPS